MAVRWTHLTMIVSEFERSIEFYERFCGLSVVRDRRKEGASTVWLGPPPVVAQDPAFVLVIQKGEVTCHIDHLGFQFSSRAEVDALAREAESAGILVYPPTDTGGSVGYWTMVRDPDGHMVEFTCGQPIGGLS